MPAASEAALESGIARRLPAALVFGGAAHGFGVAFLHHLLRAAAEKRDAGLDDLSAVNGELSGEHVFGGLMLLLAHVALEEAALSA